MRRFLVCLAALLVMGIAPPAHASNDPAFNQQWNLARMNVPPAWGASTGAGVTVGVVDSGVQADHPDLAGRVAASTRCTSGSADPNADCGGSGADSNGHGTHVSGIIAATKDNGQGVAGVAPSAQLVVARVFDDGDSTTGNDVMAGAMWAVNHGAKIVNFSLGDAGFLGLGLFVSNDLVKQVAAAVWNAGAIPVVAAGNGSCANWAGTEAVVVAASGPSDEEASYSCSAGSALRGVLAPGGNSSSCESNEGACVLSTWKDSQYAYVQGTSMAAPAVSGALALLLGQNLDRTTALNRLMSNLDAASCRGCKGKVNVSRAVCGASCPAASTPSGGGGGVPVAAAPQRPARASNPRPATVPAVTTPTTVAPTTTTEATTTTTEAPTTTTGGIALAPKRANSDSGVPIAAGLIAIAGLLTAAVGTAYEWLQRRRSTVTTLP
ncbi:MAG TPA: S8 family serine peptidase [Acidimicrobiales bacterium]|nr:S8 family serine peptidase [Acidimicrobiales bacterium]